jgi:hypothetical protein
METETTTQTTQHAENQPAEKYSSKKLWADTFGGSCKCGVHHGYVLRKLLRLAVLVIVFCLAFKMGEMKGMLEANGFYGGARHGGTMMMQRNNGGLRVQTWNANANDMGMETGGGMLAVPPTPQAAQ